MARISQQMSRLGAYYADKQAAVGPPISTPTVYDDEDVESTKKSKK